MVPTESSRLLNTPIYSMMPEASFAYASWAASTEQYGDTGPWSMGTKVDRKMDK
jgi:hypothetical protein